MVTTPTCVGHTIDRVKEEMDAEVAPAEESMAFMESLTVAQRLVQASEERQRWMAKRDAMTARKQQLLKLLQLQPSPVAHDAKSGTQTALNERFLGNEETTRVEKTDAATLARNKELQELQARAEAAQEVGGFNPCFSCCFTYASVVYGL